MLNSYSKITRILVVVVCIGLIGFGAYSLWNMFSVGKLSYGFSTGLAEATSTTVAAVVSSTTTPPGPPPFVVTHISTPESVRAVYYTSWAAGNKKYRDAMYKLLDTTEVNSVVIDIKDYTGRISFEVSDPALVKTGASERRIPDIKEFIGELHKRGAYVIGRISSFQDSYLIKDHPEWAVKTLDGQVWHDYKGVKWLDAGAKPVWDYLVAIGKESYSVGFDELNFDYIRYPSDGDLKNISYTWNEGRPRATVLKDFFSYLHESFASSSVPISADLFGLVTSAQDDLGIGQVLENALPYFDYIDPMVYPSHFGKGFLGYDKPAQHPYDVVKYSMDQATKKTLAASSTPAKIRPWLQAFDLGAIYTPAMVRTQMKATYDAGLNSWLLWNAASVYDASALLSKGEVASYQGTTTSLR